MRLAMAVLGISIACVTNEARAATVAAELPDIPAARPRLWLTTPELRAQAAAWLAASPEFQAGDLPRPDDYAGNAFAALLTGDPARCAAPIDWLVNFTLPDIGNVSSDNSRWYGESAALVFDWCFHAMGQAQRNTVIGRWNGYLDTLHAKPWGGRGFSENNYFWGYLRNNLEWAIATWHENPHAPVLLEAAIATRYDTWFIDEHAATLGAGGVPGEGTQYGRYMLGYPAVPFLTLRDYGIDLYARTPWFGTAIYPALYGTLPQPTPAPTNVRLACDERYWYAMPFNDDETFLACEPEAVRGQDWGMYMLAMGEAADGAQRDHARHWFDTLQPQLPFWARFRAPSASLAGVDALPLDYFAPGPGFLFARSGRGADASVVLLQLGAHGQVGHRHNDTGSFQFWRDGEWISRETTGYTDIIPGYGGGAGVDVLDTVGHNGVLFEGRGERGWTSGGPRDIVPGSQGQNPDGMARVLRVHHHEDFLYAAVDLSEPYRAERSNDRCRYDWPFAESAIREFVFVRDLEVLVVFDRLLSGGDSLGYTDVHCLSVGFTPYAGPRLAAEQVRKAFVAHFLAPPSIVANSATAAVGEQTARVEMLWPSNTTRRMIDETRGNAASVGQRRLEVESGGTALTHFVHMVHSTRASEPAASATLDASGDPWRLTLSKPGQQDVMLELLPGAASLGGAIVTAAGRTVLLDRVQHSWVDGDGPHWENLSVDLDRIFRNGFE